VTYVDSIDCDELRIILCLEFEAHAPPHEVAAFKSALVDSQDALYSVESAGSFDFLVELNPSDMASFNDWLKEFGSAFAKLVARCEECFVCRRYVRRTGGDRALWVRSGESLKRIDLAVVDKIVADGDYVQVYAEQQKWLLHSTMHSLRARLDTEEFLQLHRSIIVRRGFMDRLTHHGRSWSAHLRDGTTERISKAHVAEVLRVTRSPPPVSHSSTRVHSDDAALLRLAKS
jgi:DNA-binding LytR/AlgR family response regulator